VAVLFGLVVNALSLMPRSDYGDTASDNPERQEKRRRFQEARRNHYTMRESLTR
jgi:hypothetical protein